ncbi:YerC/YecD family TrpR-related protein [Irregularibacter muris]|uniref:YerC/YecD family TrpR-related protein n=1 Tax=Irregularibacter muris TaxID=1796619 RepID=A0AAE3HJ63_9FIRM|nr:YerC/YecD family TrpR-related protein [Irregularibacter muris]MCR1899663.1 YerC/YecD family TrpR-related protein [Irregularibacter muris]
MDHHHSKIKDRTIDELFQAILKLENLEECYRFFEDICTIKEIQSIAQRLQVAKLLKENVKYTQIEEETKASTATISRVNRSLKYGANGYLLILERLGYGDVKREE